MDLPTAYLLSLESIASELDGLAEQRMLFTLYPNEEIHKNLIRIKPHVLEFIIRVKNVNPDVAETVSKEYEQLLRLTKESRKTELVKTYLRSYAEGLRRIIEVLSAEAKTQPAEPKLTEARGDKADLPNSIPAKIWAMLCKLYEITLKVIVDAILDRFWPKPQ